MRTRLVLALTAALIVSMVGPAFAYPIAGAMADPDCDLSGEPSPDGDLVVEEPAEDGVVDPVAEAEPVSEPGCDDVVAVDPEPADDSQEQDGLEGVDGEPVDGEEPAEDDAEGEEGAEEAAKGAAFGACMRDKLLGTTGHERFVVCLPLKPGKAHGVRARFAETPEQAEEQQPEESADEATDEVLGDGAEVGAASAATAVAPKAKAPKAAKAKAASSTRSSVKAAKAGGPSVKAAKAGGSGSGKGKAGGGKGKR